MLGSIESLLGVLHSAKRLHTVFTRVDPDRQLKWSKGSMAIAYFAFGSYMLLEAALKKARPIRAVLGTASHGGYALQFNNLSKDGSGKANIVPSADSRAVVYGVLYHLDEDERPRPRQRQKVWEKRLPGSSPASQKERRGIGGGRLRLCRGARGDSRRPTSPFQWYKKRLVIEGATENGLPESYVRQIEAVEAVPDPIHPSPRSGPRVAAGKRRSRFPP